MRTAVPDDRTVAFGRAHDEVDDLLAADLTRLDGDSILGSWRELERLQNRLAAVEHRFVVEAERRGLAGDHGARDVAVVLPHDQQSTSLDPATVDRPRSTTENEHAAPPELTLR